MSQKQNQFFPTFIAIFMYLFDNHLDHPKIPANHHPVGLEQLALSTQSVTLFVTANLDLSPNLTPLLDVDLNVLVILIAGNFLKKDGIFKLYMIV